MDCRYYFQVQELSSYRTGPIGRASVLFQGSPLHAEGTPDAHYATGSRTKPGCLFSLCEQDKGARHTACLYVAHRVTKLPVPVPHKLPVASPVKYQQPKRYGGHGRHMPFSLAFKECVCLSVYVHVCVCACICVYVFMCVCMHGHVCACICTCVCMHVCMCMCMCVRTCM